MLKNKIVLTIILLISTIVFFGLSDLDILIQSYFFNFETKEWILNSSKEPYRFIFYDGIKYILIIILLSSILSLVFFQKNVIVKRYKQGIILFILSALLILSSVSILKKQTNMPCPKNEVYFGGEYPSTKVWEKYSQNTRDTIRCWPAGHASGGFALMSLFFLFNTKRNKFLSLFFAVSIGWSMGIYKMIIGDHYFSHTLITMLLSVLIILILNTIISRRSFK